MLTYAKQEHILYCQGNWTIEHIQELKQQINQLAITNSQPAIDGCRLNRLDSSGALLLVKLIYQYQAKRQNFADSHQALIDLIIKQQLADKKPVEQSKANLIYRLGKTTVQAAQSGANFLAFLGEVMLTLCKSLTSSTKLRWREIASTLQTGGYAALPIVGLLSFLIGVVLAYQMGIQLQTYGANIYIVNFLGLAIFREFGPLLTAIIVAGRTGSAFTAQLGMMQINEEVDALRTMGIPPIELLVLPRILGLVIALPLLSVWSDAFGILGGMIMSQGMLNIHYIDFLQRFEEVIKLKTYVLGLIKTPVFALIIASIGCYQGLQVSGSAESVGRLTTKSVVQAIFYIIVADAAFSILYSWLRI